MSVEPQKFYVGVIDLFSVLLPGALLTFLLKDSAGPRLFGRNGYDAMTSTQGWVVFLFCSYLLGHFVFLIGSWLLDDFAYDPARKATEREQIGRLSKGEMLSPRVARFVAKWCIKPHADSALREAVKVKQHYLTPLAASSAINAFQWCKARLTTGHHDALASVERFEADSKFFRSLVVVLLMIVPWAFITAHWGLALSGTLMLALAFWRYIEQRVKSVTQAYWFVLTLEAENKDGYRASAPTITIGPTHAGGVVYRQNGYYLEYLLVQASKHPNQHVLPKGHIEADETPAETAVREVREETGVWARVLNELDMLTFDEDGASITVKFYLMETLEEHEPKEHKRKHEWLSLQEAVQKAAFDEAKALLQKADAIIRGIAASEQAAQSREAAAS